MEYHAQWKLDFYEYRDGDREENVRQCEGNFVALSMLADTPAGTDLSGWSHEQVAWALAGAGGAFAQEAAEELYSRLCAAPEAVLREITALGQSRRSAVLWHLAGEACAGKASDDERDWIEGLNRLSALPPAVQDTAQRFEQYCDVRRPALQRRRRTREQAIPGPYPGRLPSTGRWSGDRLYRIIDGGAGCDAGGIHNGWQAL